jgi:hypothetical protein
MKFEKGDRVEMTSKARMQFPDSAYFGTVTSLLGGHSIRVRRAGIKTPETWHDSLWKRRSPLPTGLNDGK